ncbi:thiol-disulfide oxidoreductase DCC family protein [Aestuariimicrobium soli]|uniref:thiol-disulfide oxidoreductase DCC family protein n=1 Tax=Aestuariimicrobium soli TaxID=2035834 RepID=UPI003EBE9DF4
MSALLYDPDCGFCTRSARLLAKLGPRAEVRPLQLAGLDSGGPVDSARASCEVPFVRDDGTVVYGAAAIAAVLVTCRQPWRLVGRVLGSRPGLWVARPVYALVATNRHRLPGGTAACDLTGRGGRAG